MKSRRQQTTLIQSRLGNSRAKTHRNTNKLNYSQLISKLNSRRYSHSWNHVVQRRHHLWHQLWQRQRVKGPLKSELASHSHRADDTKQNFELELSINSWSQLTCLKELYKTDNHGRKLSLHWYWRLEVVWLRRHERPMKRKNSKPGFFFLSRSSPGAARTPRTRRSRTELRSISGEEESEEDGERPEQHPAAVPPRPAGGRRQGHRAVHVQRITGIRHRYIWY